MKFQSLLETTDRMGVFNQSLELMWKGMLTIFIVMILLTVIVAVIGVITNKFANNKNSSPE